MGAGVIYVPDSLRAAEPPAFIREHLRRNPPATENRQLLIAAGKKAADVGVRLYGLRRAGDGSWQLAFGPLAATVGYRGFAAPGRKREGDGRSPSGRYRAGFAFGYAPVGSVATRMPYRQVRADHFWNTDPASPHYNTWRAGDPAGASYENMRRRDQQYRLGLVIRYNMDPVVPGYGSAIFLHVWRGAGLPTAGCIGVAENEMRRILDWLDPASEPMIVMGTEATIRAGKF